MLPKNVEIANKTVLVTGAAGFIGANLVMKLLNSCKNIKIVGLDKLNDYYDVHLKEYRLKEISKIASITCNNECLDKLNDYYDVHLKEYRLKEISKIASITCNNEWTFIKGNIADKQLINMIFF